jgi:hypothetical protein
VIATADEEGWAIADVDLAATRSKTLTDFADLHGDRRPELYGAVVAPSQPV